MPLVISAERQSYGGPSAQVTAATVNYRISHTEDDWAFTQEYVQHTHSGAATTCDLQESGTATRTINGVAQSGGPSIDDYATWPVTITSHTTERITAGTNDCAASGPPFTKCTGTITEELETQDTTDDALNRAEPGLTWNYTPPECIYNTSWKTPAVASGEQSCMAFQDGNAQVKWAAVIGHSYRITVYLKQRPIGGSSWTDYGTATAEKTAAATSEETDWLSLPVIEGLEILASSNKVEDIT